MEKSALGAQYDEQISEQTGKRISGQKSGGQRVGLEKERDLSEQLWCVHIEGINDYVAAMSREAAEREASAINAYIEHAGDKAPASIVRATAIEWPFTAAGHARSLEVDWDDLQHMPHRLADADSAEEALLPSIWRRLKALMRGA
ncbi:hypothetical protein [Paraburkholderia diazotrophica]|uniref:hypothetical protein n=1 Tax=Paraburkholderia diazotrophica TaxID=667676 RepID=UPI002ADE69B4|nr:hypothetical protein [Paraburkholderia diazotrophica]